VKTIRPIIYGLLLASALLYDSFAGASRAASPALHPSQDLPPVVISDSTFNTIFWTTTAEVTGDGTFTVTQQLTGGNPDKFRMMSHRLPPVPAEELYTVSVTHLFQGAGANYNPFSLGEIRAIDYVEDGIILSFPFADAFSTTQPVIEQGGRIFRATQFLRFTAQNSSHNWETKSLNQLTAADFVAEDGSGDHPDFSIRGGTMRFGFTRANSRSATLPPVPSDQDLVIDQGVDNWQVTVHRDDTARPPQAEDDTFILDGNMRSLPLFDIFDVSRNDSDPNHDRLEITEVTEPIFGSAGNLSEHTIVYQLDEARTSDSFNYTISDGALTDDAQVQVLVDCACTVLCLSTLELPERALSQETEPIDLPLIYAVRDHVLKLTPDGERYVELYYTSNPEILVKLMANEELRSEAVATVALLQEPLHSLVYGDGSARITQEQVDALAGFLDNLSEESSEELQQIIANELDRLGSLDDYVGLTVREAKQNAIGNAIFYMPLIRSRQ
jgi:hypothetical protein